MMDKPVVPNCRVVVEVPATVANLGAGFDVLGMALGSATPTTSVSLIPGSRLSFRVKGSQSASR